MLLMRVVVALSGSLTSSLFSLTLYIGISMSNVVFFVLLLFTGMTMGSFGTGEDNSGSSPLLFLLGLEAAAAGVPGNRF